MIFDKETAREKFFSENVFFRKRLIKEEELEEAKKIRIASKEKKIKETTIRNDKLIELYLSGISVRELRKIFNITHQRIYSILHAKKNIVDEKRKLRKRQKKEDEKKIIKLYKEGYRITEIAKITDYSNHSVAKIIKDSI